MPTPTKKITSFTFPPPSGVEFRMNFPEFSQLKLKQPLYFAAYPW